MKALLPLLVVLLSSCVVRAHHPAPPPVVVQVSVFDAHLAPYGSWIVVPAYGRVWSPAIASVGPDFYPYGTGGSWRYTDAGWVFESEYPFGWAVFHYGRWYFDPQLGWLWVPGETWGPAWVMWRTGGAYVGWAPLGPAGAPPFHHHHWCFVDAHRFREHDVRRHHMREGNFHAAVAVTTPVPAAHPGPPPAWLSQTTRQPPVVAVPVQALPGSGRVPPPPPRNVTPPPPPRDATPPPPRVDQPPPLRDATLPPPPRDATPPPPRVDQPPPLRDATLPPLSRDVTPPPPRVDQPPPLRDATLPPPPRDVTPPPPRVDQPPPLRDATLPPPPRDAPPPRVDQPPPPRPPVLPPARVEPPRPAVPPPARLERGPNLPTPQPPPPPAPQKKDKVPLPPKGKVVRPAGP